MSFFSSYHRALRLRRSRGQMIVLAAVSLLVLALVVFITFNVTVAVQQRIKLQNYADAKAFSMAVAEARTLNYLAYTNRAIASAYVGMANVHAYMTEAAMLADLKAAAATIMEVIVGQEFAQCDCCVIGGCCFWHCVDAFEAQWNAAALGIDYLTGGMGGPLSQLDGPASDAVSALSSHIEMLHGSQTAAKAAVTAMLNSGSFGSLKNNNMQKAASVTTDESAINDFNVSQWEQAFDTRTDIKKKIMAETANASRQDFTWNRTAGGVPISPLLFPQLSQRVSNTSGWINPPGLWTIAQLPDAGAMAGGRTGFATNAFSDASSDVESGSNGSVVTSFDWGTLFGQWKHGGSASVLPLSAGLVPAILTSGSSNSHSGGFFSSLNDPHNGSDHNVNMDMSRFEEFRIGTDFPYNQPYVYAGVSTDTRVNEHGLRGPWEVAKDGSGTVTVTNVGEDGKLTLSNNNRAKAFSKALVYYHRIGDWSDYPNLFNPYWRAKLQPVTSEEVLSVLSALDSEAADVATNASGINSGAVNTQ
jgi:hypothetical protein